MTDGDVKAVAKQAVREFLLELGIDASKPDAILEIQADFAHLRRWRKAGDLARVVTIRTAVTVVITAVTGWLIASFWPK